MEALLNERNRAFPETMGIPLSGERCLHQIASERVAKKFGTFVIKRLQHVIVCCSQGAGHAWAEVIRTR